MISLFSPSLDGLMKVHLEKGQGYAMLDDISLETFECFVMWVVEVITLHLCHTMSTTRLTGLEKRFLAFSFRSMKRWNWAGEIWLK